MIFSVVHVVGDWLWVYFEVFGLDDRLFFCLCVFEVGIVRLEFIHVEELFVVVFEDLYLVGHPFLDYIEVGEGKGRDLI